MKKRVEINNPQYRDEVFCDYCGGENVQDNVIKPFKISFGEEIDLHHDCVPLVKTKVREAFGLQPLE